MRPGWSHVTQLTLVFRDTVQKVLTPFFPIPNALSNKIFFAVDFDNLWEIAAECVMQAVYFPEKVSVDQRKFGAINGGNIFSQEVFPQHPVSFISRDDRPFLCGLVGLDF